MDSTSSSSDSAAAAGLIAGGVIVYCLVIAVMVAVFIWIYWRIFAKAGYNGALALLNLVPGVGPLICILILAFGRWPIEDQLAGITAGRSVIPPSGPPPGSSVMTP
jgi:ABC-type spermidine/putrescine transport system permease subunit II